MDTNQPRREYDASIEIGSDSLAKNFMSNVFSWMAVGLVVTACVSWYVFDSGLYQALMLQGGIMPWVIMLSPFAFLIAMNVGLNKFSSSTLVMLFVAFSATMGVSLSSVFLMYEMGSIAQVFGITAGTFTIMAVVGYTTSMDLTKFGSLLFMGVIGIILASVVNMWFMDNSTTMDYIISIAGVLIFTGLIAYDTQRIKRIGAGVEYGSESATKLAILAATSLYLDFINLFLFLLRLIGRRS
jgi:FtsH-binding integral membrane protein